MQTVARLRRLLPLAAALFVLSGCTDYILGEGREPWWTRKPSRALRPVEAWDRIEGDPVALATTGSVAVIPFANESGDASLDADALAQRLASRLASGGEVRVIYPRRFMAVVAEENRAIRLHNQNLHKNRLLGKSPQTDRQQERAEGAEPAGEVNKPKTPLDPARVDADAIKIGRRLGVDAVLTGTVTDFDPYYRPRISLTVRLLATGQNTSTAEQLSQLSQWGVPRGLNSTRGPIWIRQQLFDTQDGGTAREIYLYARNRHTEHSPFDTEIYLRSMDRFFEYVGDTVADKLLDAQAAARAEAVERARREAERRGLEREAFEARLRALLGPANLPDEELVEAQNIRDRRDKSWRRDVYGQGHPRRVKNTEPEPAKGVWWRRMLPGDDD